jgi:hypothetical protein
MTMCGDWRSEERDQWLPSFEANLASSYEDVLPPATWEEVEPIMATLPEYAMWKAELPPTPPPTPARRLVPDGHSWGVEWRAP